MKGSFSIAAIACGLAVSGCTSVEPHAVLPSDVYDQSFALIQVERVSDEISGSGGFLEAPTHATVKAMFARYRGIDDSSLLDVLGLHRPNVDLDSCSEAEPLISSASTGDATVDLLDAGALEIVHGNAQTQLDPHTFPELGSVVGGVFYAGDARRSNQSIEEKSYHVQVEGTGDVPPWFASISEPTGLRVTSIGGVVPEGATTISVPSRVDLKWESTSQGSDRIDIEIVARGRAIRCSANDDGAFQLELPVSMNANNELKLTVWRTQVTPLQMGAFDDSWAVSAIAQSFRVVLAR